MPVDHLTKESGIYQIRCIANGRVYIGSAENFQKRWKAHRGDLCRGAHHSAHLQRAWRQLGAGQFIFEVLALVPEKTDLVRVEQQYLNRVRPFDPAIGYNISPTAGSPLGVKQTAETRAKCAARSKARVWTEESRAKISASKKGRPRSAETIAKMSAATKGKKPTAETRAKLSKAHKGRPCPEKAKAKTAERNRTSEARARSAAVCRARKWTPEERAKIAASNKARVWTPEMRAKLVARNKRRYARHQAKNQAKFPFMD